MVRQTKYTTQSEAQTASAAAMKIAVEGCCHGELDQIYDALTYAERVSGVKVDLLVCCGDFQAVRNEVDLATMYVHLLTQSAVVIFFLVTRNI